MVCDQTIGAFEGKKKSGFHPPPSSSFSLLLRSPPSFSLYGGDIENMKITQLMMKKKIII